jgi:excinuclease ABC subunit B
MYADSVTPAMKNALGETSRRRTVQGAYNEKHGIVPQTVVRAVMNINPASGTIDYLNVPKLPKGERAAAQGHETDMEERLAAMRLEMFAAAENLEFEKAARLRDELKKLAAMAGIDNEAKPDTGTFDPYPSNGKRKSTGMRAKGTGTAKAGGAARNGRRYKAR